MFYAIGNVGDSKKTDNSRVNDKNDPKEYILEITDYNVPLGEFPTGYGTNGKEPCPESEWKVGNIAYDHLYTEYEYEDGEFKSFGNKSYEFRYEMKDITEEQRQVNIDTWREMYKFLATATNEEFYTRLKEWFVVDSALYFYLYTERYTLVDNRCKNSFWHYGKVYITQAEATTLGEAAGGYIIDDEQAALHDGYRYDLTQFYDADTSLGIDNTGKLVLTYGKEDTDYYVDDNPESGYIYRAAESTFFCRIRDLFASELQAMFVDRENVNAWSADSLIKQWDDAQSQFPEEIWRLDIERKYLRTYLGKSIDNSKAGEANPRFLTEMMNGRKKYQRRMFERNQELYMATKYFGKVATQDQIMMRFNNPVGASIRPDFTLYLTPYSDMYIGVKFGNVTPVNFRAKAGVEYTVPYSIETDTADITLIYGASFIQAIGDLSKCYVGDNDFSKASRLQSLVIGSDTDGYENSFMTKIALGNNKLLEYLDIRNVTGLNSVVDLSQCGNLIELHAENSGATGVIFANGGKVEKAYIPTVTSLTAKNLNYLKDFVIESYNKLQTLVVEYTPYLNTYDMVNVSPILKVLRLIGIDWDLENTDLLDRILSMRGINNTGGEISTSVLDGDVFVPVIRQQELRQYQEAWKDLDINYNTLIEQFAVTFKNEDGTVLDVQYVDKGKDAVDPITRAENPITTPTKESTVSHNFTFAGWDSGFTGIFADRTITATYTSSLREYTVKYASKDITVQESKGLYGSYISYTGDTPTYTLEESAYVYHLFNHWDKNGFVDGDKTINAVYDRCEYVDGYFRDKELSDMTPVEIYALTKLIERGQLSLSQNSDGSNYTGVANTNIEPFDSFSFSMGHDVDIDGVSSEVLINEARTFSGTLNDYYDTGISLFDIDRSFVLAIDYEFASGNSNNATLMQCYNIGTSDGFRLRYSSSGYPTIGWYDTSEKCANGTNREMLVIRHKAGEYGAHVYISNLSDTEIGYIDFSSVGIRIPSNNSTLVFGCNKVNDTTRESYAKGTIHWAKVWYDDLGDVTCRELASYIHETVETNLCGFNRYYISGTNNERRPVFSFLGSKALYTERTLDTDGSNVGGWSTTDLNNWLNTRFYNGLPLGIKQLVKKVVVMSTPGGTNTSPLAKYDGYIYIPAIADIVRDQGDSYENEISPGKLISYISSPDDRVRTNHDGVAVEYWTRSPSLKHSTYFYYVNTSGGINAIGQVTGSITRGVVIMFSI